MKKTACAPPCSLDTDDGTVLDFVLEAGIRLTDSRSFSTIVYNPAGGIHLTGTIHNLGKIQTQAEILSKPGKLSHGELVVIKDHAQNSYNIPKGIVFE